MANTTPPTEGRANLSAGHLSVHVEGAHPAEELFLFEEQQKRLGPALIVSLAYHAALVVLVLLAFRYGADSATDRVAPRTAKQQHHLAERTGPRRWRRRRWKSDEGAAAAGGVARQGQDHSPGHQAAETGSAQRSRRSPSPVAQLNIPAQTLAAATESLPGAIEPPPGPPTVSQGSGTSGGAGTGAPEAVSDPEQVQVWALAPAATPAVAPIGRAAASRCRSSSAK